MIELVAETRKIVASSLEELTEVDLDQPYVEEVLGYPITTCYFLLHMASHLAYHLGQINYLRRIMDLENFA